MLSLCFAFFKSCLLLIFFRSCLMAIRVCFAEVVGVVIWIHIATLPIAAVMLGYPEFAILSFMSAASGLSLICHRIWRQTVAVYRNPLNALLRPAQFVQQKVLIVLCEAVLITSAALSLCALMMHSYNWSCTFVVFEFGSLLFSTVIGIGPTSLNATFCVAGWLILAYITTVSAFLNMEVTPVIYIIVATFGAHSCRLQYH